MVDIIYDGDVEYLDSGVSIPIKDMVASRTKIDGLVADLAFQFL